MPNMLIASLLLTNNGPVVAVCCVFAISVRSKTRAHDIAPVLKNAVMDIPKKVPRARGRRLGLRRFLFRLIPAHEGQRGGGGHVNVLCVDRQQYTPLNARRTTYARMPTMFTRPFHAVA